MTGAIAEFHAEASFEPIAEGVAARRDAALYTEFETLKRVVEQDVDHAADRARAPCRGRAAGDDLDALDHPLRNGVEIARTGKAAPIEQSQRARRAKAAKICRRRSRSGAREIGDRRSRRAELGQVVKHLRNARPVALKQIVAADDRRGRRRAEARLVDARTGHDDRIAVGRGFYRFDLGVLFCCDVGRLADARHECRSHGPRRCREHQPVLKIRALHVFPLFARVKLRCVHRGDVRSRDSRTV